MRFMKFATGTLLALLFTCTTVQAQVLLSVSNEVDVAGSTLEVTVGISDTSGGGAVLNNYNIPIVLGADPLNLFELSSGPVSSNPGSFSNFAANPTPPVFNFDFLTSDSGGAGITLSSTPTDLFTLSFDIDPAAPAGALRTVGIQQDLDNAGNLQLSLDNVSIVSGSDTFGSEIIVSNGSVSTPAAIPEPSALCGLLLGSLFIASRRRRVA